MNTVKEIEAVFFAWAPAALAEEWDNVGHLVGDGSREVRKALIALDITEAVVDEAIARDAQLILSHHPVMNCTWQKVQNILTDDRQGRILTKLVEHHISAICMHTNLDAAAGGVNDILAEKLGISDLEMLNDEKIGRVGTLKCEIPLAEYIPFVVKSLSCNGLRYTDSGKPVHRIAVGGGACGNFIAHAIAKGCDTFITADLGYHDFLNHPAINLIDAGHFPTENLICPVIAAHLAQQFPDIAFIQSTTHRDVIQYYM
jgi:dinuclear metal center YbgI/SA1388 family protein